MTENEKRLNYLRDSLEGSSAASIRKFIATTLGSIPVAGGAISAISGIKDDINSREKDEVILALLKDHDDKLSCIWNAVFGNEPSKEKLAYLFAEILGIDIPQNYIEGNYFAYFMSLFSREEFRIYEKLGWLTIKNTGNYEGWVNPGTAEALPLIKVEGSDTEAIAFDFCGEYIIIRGIDPNDPVFIDCDAGYIYTESGQPMTMEGNIPVIPLGISNVYFNWEHPPTKLTVTPRWRWV